MISFKVNWWREITFFASFGAVSSVTELFIDSRTASLTSRRIRISYTAIGRMNYCQVGAPYLTQFTTTIHFTKMKVVESTEKRNKKKALKINYLKTLTYLILPLKIWLTWRCLMMAWSGASRRVFENPPTTLKDELN